MVNKYFGSLVSGGIKKYGFLSETEYLEFRRNSEILIKFSTNQHGFVISQLNLNDFINTIESYAEEYSGEMNVSWTLLESTALNINRLILNILSSMRTYLDHTEYRLKKEFGKDSEIVQVFKRAAAYCFDNHFSYRFLYMLRNYSQHCGMPLGKIHFNSEIDKTDSTLIHHTFALLFDREELLNRFSDWRKVEPELRALPEFFDVIPLVLELEKLLPYIHYQLVKEDLSELVAARDFILKMCKPALEKNEYPCVLFIPEDTIKETCEITVEHIPLHVIELIKYIEGLKETTSNVGNMETDQ